MGCYIWRFTLATKSLVKKGITKITTSNRTKLKQKITDYIGKAIKPSTAGKSANQLKSLQRKQLEGFQVLKNNVNDIKLPDEFGNIGIKNP